MEFKEKVRIIEQKELAQGIFSMWIETDQIGDYAKPGQFISIYSNDGSRLLPRPISICEIDGKKIRMVYRVAGKGTEEFSGYTPGDWLDVLGPLGNGYDLAMIKEYVKANGGKMESAILFGGGIGVPPMLELAKNLDCKKNVVLGYRNADMFLKEEFEAVEGATLTIATEDGSVGTKGNVLDAVREQEITGDVIFACGPTPMLRAIQAFAEEKNIPCFISLEEKMACGIGACLACVCKTKEVDDHSHVHNARICKDGPVFNAKEVEL
ncbi:MAG: dihydroorotate dehydrogenase electron transfer subunit [Lachnospiraceae bacterium]